MYINKYFAVALIAALILITSGMNLIHQIGTVAVGIHDGDNILLPAATAFMHFTIIFVSGRVASRAIARTQA
ncbi:hypothetical protein [Deinococcus sp. UR1]|uniref:hypothetical protein n=1 Tax=Deinococcus sp. UR1 TaxID=1704277 RepID=UPI000C1816C2|nr:hypothetical protein [Deinococcus sp. UR1]PIG96905.1 hypothetical protein AMD26_015375 [Deinococcus sp. UR1]